MRLQFHLFHERENMQMLSEIGLAAYLGVSVAACRKWRAEGRGPTYIKVGRLVRYRMTDIEAWLSTRPQGGEAANTKQEAEATQ